MGTNNPKLRLFYAFIILGVIAWSFSRNFGFGRFKWGFIDKTGALVIPCQFDDVAMDNYGGFEDPNYCHGVPKAFRNFSEGLCAVRIGNKWGYIDKTGKVVISPQFDSAGIFSEGLACVRKGRKVGYID